MQVTLFYIGISCSKSTIAFNARNYQRFPNCLQVQAIACKCTQLHASHPELTRVRSIRFLLFEIKRVLVYTSTLFKHSWRDNLLIYGFVVPHFFIQNMYMPLKKYSGKKANKICLMGQIGIESYNFLEYWQNLSIHVK